ncbi:single-stranded DNA-binding protein [bacterium]|nr:single-stranded DNA-binding protein [bacterium]
MAGVNKVILVGNLGKDPEVRHTPQGMAVGNFPIATSESWNDKSGQKQERTEWHRIVVWGKLAELCQRYLSKGRKAYVEGRLQTRAWDDKDGNKRYTTEIVATTVQFLDSAAGAGAERSSGGGGMGDDPFGAPPDFGDPNGGSSDEIPF